MEKEKEGQGGIHTSQLVESWLPIPDAQSRMATPHSLGLMIHAGDPSTWEVETKVSLGCLTSSSSV